MEFGGCLMFASQETRSFQKHSSLGWIQFQPEESSVSWLCSTQHQQPPESPPQTPPFPSFTFQVEKWSVWEIQIGCSPHLSPLSPWCDANQCNGRRWCGVREPYLNSLAPSCHDRSKTTVQQHFKGWQMYYCKSYCGLPRDILVLFIACFPVPHLSPLFQSSS